MNEERKIRIVVVDDHPVVRGGMALLLTTYADMDVIAEASDGEEAIARCSELEPDVVVIDLAMPGIDGPDAIAHLHARYPKMQFVVLTSLLEEKMIQRAFEAGANSYLLKSVSADRLAQAIRGAARGESTIDASAAQLLVQATTRPAPLGHDLTPREREVLALLVTGKTNPQIAEALTLSHGTVRVYVSKILAKLGASNRTEAVSLALQHDLLAEE
jgi:NarL family two-component system response regulator LiaR